MNNCKCPNCGAKLEFNITSPGSISRHQKSNLLVFQSSHRSIFKNIATASDVDVPAGYTAERQSPAFLPTKESNVIVPLLESLITGAFIGVGTVAGVTYAQNNFLAGLTWGGIAFVSVSFVQWIRLTGNYRNLLWRLETITGVDIDGSGEVGLPAPPPPTVRVEVLEGSTWKFENLPGDNKSLQSFSRDVTNGIHPFSERGASDNGYGAANFRKLRDLFVARGWAGWNHPNHKQQGVSLTRAGVWLIKQIADTPLPSQGVPGRESPGTSARSSTHAQDGDTLYGKFEHI